MASNMVQGSIDDYSCPPLTDTDYLLSSKGINRKVSHTGSRSAMNSPVGLGSIENGDHEERLTIESRRFTPTLQANLVSEILALRREVESKNSLVLNLEEHMVQVKDENTKLQESVSAGMKERKSLKRHMDALENGTLAAIEDMARERDQAVETLADIKTQLERSQKRARNHEEDIKRTQNIIQQDQEKWDSERRSLERKIHVVEGRLKTVLAEVATQPTFQRRKSIDNPQFWTRERASSRGSIRRSIDSQHRETLSVSTSVGGRTLADELYLEISDVDSEDCLSPEALPEEARFVRSHSSQSNRQSLKARKLLGLHVEAGEETSANKDSTHNGQLAAPVTQISPPQSILFSDVATQWSPPPSPVLSPEEQRLSTITEFDGDSMLDDTRMAPIPLAIEKLQPAPMVSSSCQTISTPLSPPDTPNRSRSESCETYKPMVSSSTQTSENLFTATLGSRPSVPAITAQDTKQDVSGAIPPNSRNASTQVHIVGEVVSTAVQTDSIRTDARLTKLPAHLHPDIILPISPTPSPRNSTTDAPQIDSKDNLDIPVITGFKRKVPSKKPIVTRSILRKTKYRTSHNQSESEDDFSDDSFLQRQPIKKVLSKVDNSWQMIAPPAEDIENLTDTEETPPQLPTMNFEDFSVESTKLVPESPRRNATENLIQSLDTPDKIRPLSKDVPNDIKANIGRARSPSEPIKPTRISGLPFPVPDRSSSRKFPWLTDDMESPTRKPMRQPRGPRASKRTPGIRKSRSEIGDHGFSKRPRSPSPQPFDAMTESLANIPPPLPENDLTLPGSGTLRKPSQTHMFPTQSEALRTDQASIVDSIAQTMIGEWMYKYVRRRKSFGIPDEHGTGENSVNGGIRHQRWVWVAPYERAVMWSSKQPTSGSALMGKSGRKLVISSVLDVHDDSPMPKGAPQSSHFGRSILILTPQRALKFTATSIERHFVWMNALSFLSQGAVDFADIVDAPPPVPSTIATEKSRPESVIGHRPGQPSMDGSLHRSKINDSIRIAKGKERPTPGQRKVTDEPEETNDEQNLQKILLPTGAEAPFVPRTSADTRRRSNTTSRGYTMSSRALTSSSKTSLQSSRSRGADALSDVSSPLRSSLRLWPIRTQRVVSEPTGSKEVSRAPSRQSNHVEESNLAETMGTMRMSAFVQDSTEDHENSRSTTWRGDKGTSIMTHDVETSHSTDLPAEKSSRKSSLHSRQKDKHNVTTVGSKHSTVSQSIIAAGGKDPFDGF